MTVPTAAHGAAAPARSRAAGATTDDAGEPSGPGFCVLESKLAPGPVREGAVDRLDLLDHLAASPAPVVSVTAPAGSGKTTLLAQWAAADERPFAWVSLDAHDDDPAVLLGYVAVALDRIAPVDPRVFEALRAPAPAIRSVVVPRLGAALHAGPPVVIVLDDLDRLHDPGCLDALVALVDHLPRGARLAVAGRSVSGLPVARLRAQGRLLELGADRLALDAAACATVVSRAGVDVTDAEAAQLARATEGWATGVYLAALSAREAGDGKPGRRLTRAGHDRLVRDYLSLEVLAGLSEEHLRFVTRTAVLDRMCGPLCDAAAGTEGSGALLDDLERAGLFVVPLDSEREWYRYHTLVRDVLRAELRRREPDAAREVQRRGAAWCEANDLPVEAVAYAEAAGDDDHLAALVGQLAMPIYDSGGVATVERWLERLDGDALVRRPAVSVYGAWIHALRGRPLEAERWAAAAADASVDAPLPDGATSLEPWLALLRAFLCADGLATMRADAEIAVQGLGPASRWRPMALCVLGMTHVLAGEDADADIVLADAAELALTMGTSCTASLALTERALIAIREDDSHAADALVRAARGIVRDAGIDGYVTTALLEAASARCALRRGDPRAAASDLARAERLRPLLTHAVPWLAVQAGIELARGHIGVADPGSARRLMADVDGVRRRRSRLGVLDAQADELSEQVAALRGSSVEWASTLTAAELRLLPFLTTHLSFREIGERLFVSRNTVKTEAISVYRKLGVTSRSDAIERAAELGLVDDSVIARRAAQSL